MNRSLRFLLVSGALLAVGMVALLKWGRPAGPSRQTLPVIATVGPFAVTNQAGVRVTAEDLRGRPWVINLIFTRCPGPCLQLTRVMNDLEMRLPADMPVGLMSVTSDPEFDTPEVLTAYAGKLGVRTRRWHFVTATRAEIRRLATEQLRLVLVDKPEAERTSPEDLFLHSTLLVVMDAKGDLRAVVEGLEPGAVGRVEAALEQLAREEGR